MNIQIFGKSKCFDTKKAERWFKERGIKFQSIDLLKYGMSGGEFDSVLRAIGGIDKLIDWEKKHRRSICCATCQATATRRTRSLTTLPS